MSTTHTPGPFWRDDDGFIAAGNGDSCVTIADFDCSSDIDIDEREANKALFIASPKLLLACKCALADLEGLTGYNHKRLPAYRKNEKPALTTIRELAAAIQAAEPEGK